MFCEILENIQIFAQEKEFVIKLLKILKWVNSSGLGYCILGVVRKLLEDLKYIYIYIYIYTFFFFF